LQEALSKNAGMAARTRKNPPIPPRSGLCNPPKIEKTGFPGRSAYYGGFFYAIIFAVIEMKKAVRIVLLILSAAGVAWFAAPIHWNVFNIGNQFGILVCVCVFLAALFAPQIHRAALHFAAVRIASRVVVILFCLGVVWSAVLSFLMFSVNRVSPPENATVVVLGSKASGTSPSADLRVRIETAAAYLKAHPKAVCVASGGQGAGEGEPEALVIRDGLAANGVDPSRVLLEDKSTDTKQNFTNSLQIIDQNGLSKELAVVTDDYHEYRACSIARKMGAEPYAVPAKTPSYIFSACWARELLALSAYLIIP
jgi:uncharacterized SAM-binding protein YcdF (DUF218 family)